MKQSLLKSLGVVIVLAVAAVAQGGFSSGSTGTDGAFAPTQSATIQVPASGVFNYTTVTIPSGVTITYVPNTNNTPLTILATGDIDISGTIVVSGQPGNNAGFGGLGGPGGFAGGSAATTQAGPGILGNGPGGGGGAQFAADSVYGDCSGGGGGGYATAGGGNAANGSIPAVLGGASYGSGLLLEPIGGSGGGGGTTRLSTNAGVITNGGGGGGGGGVILLASSTQIVFPSATPGGVISANGGTGVPGTAPSGYQNFVCAGGGGAGGAIHLVANTVTGTAQLNVFGGAGGTVFNGTQSGIAGGNGYVRVDAYNLSGLNATAPNMSVTSGTPNIPAPGTLPALQIASIAGVNSPSTPSGSFQNAPDVVLPANQANPVTVVVNATNIPSGTTVTLTAVSATGASATATAALSGTTASSTASLSISLPSAFSVLTATTTALVAEGRPLFFHGEKVEKIEVAAAFGGSSRVTYITQSGRRLAAVR